MPGYLHRSYIAGHNNNRHLSHEELESNIGGLPITEPKLRELFDSLDTNRCGVLDVNDVKKFYKSFDNYGAVTSDREVEEQIRRYARSDDNTVSFDEFCCIVLSIAQR
jgi:Ca2+-binding EF-hand superfamily protein